MSKTLQDAIARIERAQIELDAANDAAAKLCPVPCDGRIIGAPGHAHRATRARFSDGAKTGWWVSGQGVTKDGRDMSTFRHTFIEAFQP